MFIGFLGSATSSALGGALLADLHGLTLIAFDPVSIAVIIVVVMASPCAHRSPGPS